MENIIRYALSNGADEAEIFTRYTRVNEARTEGDKLKNDSKIIIETVIRIVVDKSITTAYLTTDSGDVIRDSINDLISLAKNTPPDPYWEGLPYPKKPVKHVNAWSSDLESIDQELLTNLTKKDLEYMKSKDNRVIPVSIKYSLYSTGYKVVNSNGVNIEDRSNGLGYFIDVKAKDGNSESNTFGFKRSKTREIESEKVIDETVNRALELLKGVKLDKVYKGPVLMDPLAVSSTLYFSLARVITGTAVQEGYSPLAKRLGEEISDKRLTIYDDGLLENGWNTRNYDEEGYPQQKTGIIVDGKLVGFIHNTYTARRMGVESTGNARRRESMIRVDITNLTIKPGSKDLDRLMSSYDELILVRNMPMGAHTINYMTGSINMVGTELYYVKKGSIEKVLKPLTITGNIYEALTDIEIGNDVEDTFFNIYTPSIVFTKFTLA